jgi:hypothetical protein
MPVSINGDGIVSGVTTFVNTTTPFTFVGVTTFGSIEANAINAGVVTSTSFVGNVTGNATGLSGTPNLNVGVVTASSFVGNVTGNVTGNATGLSGTPNLNVGVVTASSFVGNVTGNATGLSGTPNLNVGVVTATSYYGSGANLTNLNIPAGFNELDAALFN